MNPDFWPDCGHRLLQTNTQGWLQPTPAWLAAWLDRPELALVEESCRAEIALHGALRAEPLRAVAALEVAALRDADAQQNYRHWLALRDALLAAGTLEAWLLQLWRSNRITVPPLFVDLVVQAVVRSMLQDESDALVARAAEMLFRPQRLSRHEGRVLAGDRDTLDLQQETQGFGDIGRLLAQAQQPMKAVQMQVLQTDNQPLYWEDAARAGARHRFLLDLTQPLQRELGPGLNFEMKNAQSGLKSLSSVIERWVAHLLGVRVRVQPLQRIDDAQWRWHLGLDAQASALLNDLYEQRPVDQPRLDRLVSLFRLEFEDPNDMRADVTGCKVYMALMADEQQQLRVKPQNLVLNLPLAARI